MKNPFYRLSPFAFLLITTCVLSGCGNKGKSPDVSGVAVKEVHIERFDKAFFTLDSNNIVPGLQKLNKEFPYFTNDFVANILGAGPLADSNQLAFRATRQFLVSYLPVRDSLEKKYERLDWLENELREGFRHLKYYFPAYNLPQKVVTFIGPFDGPGVAITPYALAIGLQSYGGGHSPFYLEGKGLDMYPPYLSRRFEPAYISTNCMRVLAEDLFPDNSDNKPLIEQMIGKGKYWWLTDRLMPETPDSIKTGYTKKQLDWISSNEGIIWNFFLQNTDLYTIEPDIIKNFVGEGPKTMGMPDNAPGNIGAWVGWQIIKKYASVHEGITPDEVMRTPAREIFEGSKYKPR
ncbi:gliding motility lipoprotein GldB [Flavitalea flava]